MNNKDFVENLYKQYLIGKSENPRDYENLTPSASGRMYYDERGNHFTPQMRMYNYILAVRGFMGFPIVLKTKEYEEIKKYEVFHGFKSFDHASQFLTDFNYHLGYANALGTFFSDKTIEAERYTAGFLNGDSHQDSNKIMRAKIADGRFCRLSDMKTLQQCMKRRDFDRVENMDDKQLLERLAEHCYPKGVLIENIELSRIEFYEILARNPFMLAAMLGYEYMSDCNHELEYNHQIVFNRHNIILDEKELHRILDLSENYKGLEYLSE